jgi:hypothetical protein
MIVKATMNGDFLTLGKVCEILQESPTHIRRMAVAAGVQPSFTVNGIEHFSADAISRLKSAEAQHTQAGMTGETIET